MTKICTQCGIEKSLEDYHRLKSASDGRKSACKVCRRAKEGLRYKVDPKLREEAIQRSRQYYQSNKEEIAVKNKARYEKNKDKVYTT